MNNIKNSKFLVTGGAGFVGSYIVEYLLEKKPIKIIIIDNMLRGTQRNMKGFINNPIVEFIDGDIRDNSLMKKTISSVDYVFHLAALRITRCAEDQNEAFEVMAKATFNIIDLCKKHNIKKIIYSSTASVYGLAQNFPTPESDNTYDNKTFYGAAKSFGESMLRSYHDMYGLNYVALRYFNIYGPRMDTEGKYTEVMIKWFECIKNNKPPLIYGDGSTSMDFIYVKDVARANILALESEVTDEVFNVGFQRETSLKELLKIMLKVTKSNLIPEYRPDNTINPVSKRIANISKAKEILDFEANISLEEGIKKLYNWYLEIKGKVY
jgi:UDP-glucose 4-epimerase